MSRYFSWSWTTAKHYQKRAQSLPQPSNRYMLSNEFFKTPIQWTPFSSSQVGKWRTGWRPPQGKWRVLRISRARSKSHIYERHRLWLCLCYDSTHSSSWLVDERCVWHSREIVTRGDWWILPDSSISHSPISRHLRWLADTVRRQIPRNTDC